MTLKALIQNIITKEYFLIDAIDNPIDREIFNYNRDHIHATYGYDYSLNGIFNEYWGNYWFNHYNLKQ